MKEFLETLRTQRWDDHRYYHHSRINQSLHFVSAMSFIWAYTLLFSDPAAAALVAWFVAMTTRQAGHFFFEPRGYDEVNHATHEYKEEIKVGYNLRRKVVLMSIWALTPLLMLADPTLCGLLPAAPARRAFVHNVGDHLAGARRRRAAASAPSSCSSYGSADRTGVGDQDPHGSVPRHQALLQGAVPPAARRAGRPGPRTPSRLKQLTGQSAAQCAPRIVHGRRPPPAGIAHLGGRRQDAFDHQPKSASV